MSGKVQQARDHLCKVAIAWTDDQSPAKLRAMKDAAKFLVVVSAADAIETVEERVGQRHPCLLPGFCCAADCRADDRDNVVPHRGCEHGGGAP